MSGANPAATATQQQNIGDAITKVSTYLVDLLAAQHKAAIAGDLAKVQSLNPPISNAVSLKQNLLDMQSASDIAALNAAIASAKQTVTQIDNGKQQIDNLVKAIDTAATVLNVIAAVVTAVVKI
jgi:hypothetical protein